MKAVLALFVLLFLVSVSKAATFTVTNTTDSGAGSLRQAILDANAAASDDTINFSIPANDLGCTAAGVCTNALTSGEFVIISATTAGALTITNSTGSRNLLISGNNRSRVFYVNAEANLTLYGITVERGIGTGAADNNTGGGIFNNGALTVTNSAISGNRAIIDGGGIFSKGTLTVTNSTISGNTVVLFAGGGIFNTGTAMLTNTTISGNLIQRNLIGGAAISNTGTLNLTGVTVTNNRTIAGDDICICTSGIDNSSGATANLNNTIIAGNIVDFPSHPADFNGNVSSGSYNLIGSNFWTSGITHGINGNQVGTRLNPINPRLAPLSNNGGGTETHALLPDSSALNAGNNVNAPLTDQRGLPRIVGGTIDIGAYENQQAAPATFPAFGILLTLDDKPIRGAIVTYTNNATGETRTSVSNPFGYVRFNVVFGQDYSVTIKHKKYSFSNRTVVYQNSNFGVILRAQ